MRYMVTPEYNLTVETGAYASGDALGEKITITDVGNAGIIESVMVRDADKEDATFDIILFREDFTATTDNNAFDPTDADTLNIIGVIRVSQYYDFNDNAVAFHGNLGIPYNCPGGKLYAQCVSRAAQTYTATSDLQIKLGLARM